MISKRVGCCSLLSLLPLLASLPNLLLLLLRVLILPCPSSSLTLDTTTTTPTNTEPTTFDTTIPTTTPLQEDDWLHVLTDQDGYDYDEDDYWLLNQTNCFPSDPSHDQSPKKDTVDFHDVRKQIVEHVLGKKELSDPEHLRLRALAAWRYQGRQWVVVNGGPMFLSPRLGTFDGILQEGEASVDAEVEESIDGNRTISEANVEQEKRNETEEDEGTIEVNGENSEDAVEEISDGEGNEEQKEEVEERETTALYDTEDYDNSTLVSKGESDIYIEENIAYNNTEEGEGSTNELNERTNRTKREKIEEVSGEAERQELEMQERRGDALVDEPTTGISEVTVEEGTRLRLVCNVSGVKHIWVEWRRAANLTFPGGSAVVGGRSVLFDFVGREDAGTYICTARNPHGATYSTSVTIHVQYIPVVGVWGRTVGQKGVEIGCLGEGQPRPTLAWYKNNTKLPATCDGNIEVKSTPLSPGFVLSVVKITNATVSDFALYHCRAANSLGVSRSFLMLHDGSGAMSPEHLKEPEHPIIYSTPVENPRLASFLLGMVPPLYIALYIIAYLGCYKSPSTGGHGRFGGNVDMDTE